MVTAKNGCLDILLRHKLDKALGAGCNASLTGLTKVGRYYSYAVTDVYCIIGTFSLTVAESETSVDTAFVTAEKLRSHLTAVNT